MPRGIPKSGIKKPGSGRKKKYNSELVQKWIPSSLANKLDDIYLLLIDLEKEVTKWESICEEKATSPRYEQARKLVTVLRAFLDRLGIDDTDLFVFFVAERGRPVVETIEHLKVVAILQSARLDTPGINDDEELRTWLDGMAAIKKHLSQRNKPFSDFL